MIPNPIRKVLSTFQNSEVRALLMGGQACVFYGAAEFSRDTDFAILASTGNLAKLRRAMADLQAELIAVPPLTLEHLNRGHAVRFRCHQAEAAGLRVDVMAVLRGVAPFPELWARRNTLCTEDGTRFELMGLSDLANAKKTQRDKDWPMVRRLVEADYAAHTGEATAAQVRFWLREARTPELLVELAARFPAECVALAQARPVLQEVRQGVEAVGEALEAEQRAERARDRAYWEPLKRELETLRHIRS